MELGCTLELSMELEKAVLSKCCTILFRTCGVRFGEVLPKVVAEYSPQPDMVLHWVKEFFKY